MARRWGTVRGGLGPWGGSMHKLSGRLARPSVRAVAVVVVGLVVLSGCGDDAGDAGSAGGGGGVDEVVIGAAWPLSEPFEFNGNAVLAGAEAAVADINEE